MWRGLTVVETLACTYKLHYFDTILETLNCMSNILFTLQFPVRSCIVLYVIMHVDIHAYACSIYVLTYVCMHSV